MSPIINYIVIAVINVLISIVSSQMNTLSPCPRVFKYENDGQSWHGIITVGPPYESDLRLNLKMDIPGQLPSNYAGRIEMLGERSDVVLSLMNGRLIRYKVDFPTLDHIPTVTSIIFNGKQICSGPSIQGQSFTSIELKHVLNSNINNVGGFQNTPQQYGPQPGYSDFDNIGGFPNTPQSFGFSEIPSNSFPNYPTNVMNSMTAFQTVNSNGFGFESSMGINPSNPWLNGFSNGEPSMSGNNWNTGNNFNQKTPGISQTNPWLQEGSKRQQAQNTNRYPTRQPTNIPAPTEPQRKPQPARPLQIPTNAPRPVYNTDDKFDRPNPGNFAAVRNPTPTTAPENSSPENDRTETLNKCGISKRRNNPLIVRGSTTSKGDWPWLAAIFLKRVSSLNFVCGGTILSKQIIVTAAHCLGQNNNVRANKDEVIVRLGVFNIQDWVDNDAKPYPVDGIIYPPSFDNGLILRNDIVLIQVKRITYTDYILPACMWKDEVSVEPYYGKFGTVVGWGRNEDGLIASPEPSMTNQRIVTQDECRASNEAFDILISSTTFCAGNRNGTGPCNGDSGGGMFINIDGRWTLRGIVSNSLHVPDSPNVCNLADFLVYTDVTKFVKFINYYL